MRCPKCDSPMPIGGKVCKNCNFNAFTNQYENVPARPVQQPVSRPAPQRPVVNPMPAPRPVQQAAPVQQPTQTAQKPQKKKGNWFVRFALCFLAVIIGRTVGYFAGQLMAKDWKSDAPSQNSSYQQSAVPSTEKTINPAYTALLEKYGVTYAEKTTSNSAMCFAKEMGDGVLGICETGYSGDVVKEQFETLYLPYSLANGADPDVAEQALKETYDELFGRSYTTIAYSRIEGKYFVVQVHYRDMDNRNTIEGLAKDGLVSNSDGKLPAFLSAENTAQEMIASGFIQK